jgi:hypothetical protein
LLLSSTLSKTEAVLILPVKPLKTQGTLRRLCVPSRLAQAIRVARAVLERAEHRTVARRQSAAAPFGLEGRSLQCSFTLRSRQCSRANAIDV